MCGEHSEKGEISCGLNLCCSATGWCGVSGFTVGYFQCWNVRQRRCHKVSPEQIRWFFSFATIDPDTFQVAPAHPDDIPMMREFIDLSKGGKLQTWIAVGGFDFSNPNTTTHTTW
jgi:chitinase